MDNDNTTVLAANLFFYDEGTRRIIGLYDGMVFGRNEGNERFPDDRQVSREHFKVVVIGVDVYLEDLGSSNRTRVNGAGIDPHKPFHLRLNDVIEFGSQKLIFTSRKDFGRDAERSVERSHKETTQVHRKKEAQNPTRSWRNSRAWFSSALRGFAQPKQWDGLVVATFIACGLACLAAFVTLAPVSGFKLFLKIAATWFFASAAAAFSSYALRKFRKLFLLRAVVASVVFFLGIITGQWVTLYPHDVALNTVRKYCLADGGGKRNCPQAYYLSSDVWKELSPSDLERLMNERTSL